MRMTYKKKNVLLSVAATLVVGSVGLGLAFVNPVSASAEEKTFYSTGTQLNAQKEQVRFNATLTESEYAKYFDENGAAKEGTQTGMLILPWDLFDGNDMEVLNLDTYEANKTLVQNVDTTNLWSENGADGYEAWAQMDGSIIGEKNYNRVLYYVCYVTDGTTAQYTEGQKTSMSYEALLAQSTEIDADMKASLAEKYMLEYDVTFNDAYARTTSVQYGTKFSEMTSRELTDLYWDVEYTQQVSASDYITCDSTIYIKAEDQNTAELMSFDYACDATTSQIQISTNYKPTISWLPAFEGEKGVMRVESNNATAWSPQFTIKNPKQSIAEGSLIYENYDYVVVKMYIAKGVEVDGVTYDGDWDYVCAEKDAAPHYALSEEDYNRWISVKIPLSDLAAYNENQDLKIMGKDGDGATGKNSLWYIADVSLEKMPTTITLTQENYATYVTQYRTSGTHTWNAEKTLNETGAVQIDWDYTSATAAQYPGFALTNLWEYDSVKDKYDYLLVDIFVVAKNGEDGITATIDTYFSCGTTGKNLLTTITGKRTAASLAGYTMTVVLPIELINTNTVSIYARSAYSETNRGPMRMYVNNIRLLEAALKVNVEESTNANGVFELGETLNVTATDAEGKAVDMSTMRVNATRYEGGNAIGPTTNGEITFASTGKTGSYFILVTKSDGSGIMGYTIINVETPTTTA
ncbi:MAG: hypothetical protein J6A63_03150 [Clostridia bacterium]|nr:hypothetical protein [Clostridia bacterium]